MSEETIIKINEIIADYFNSNSNVNWIAAKEIMPELIKAGVFKKDEKSGLPLRKVLRALDEKGELDKIPFVHPERIEKNTYWYLVREGTQYAPKEVMNPISKKQRILLNRKNSDEYYIINLCDELLNEKAARQHTFDFLLGDMHQDGRTRTKLPLDAYYDNLNLVIEYAEKQSDDPVSEVHNSDKMTISGVKRSEQRKIYKTRKKEVLRKKQINFIEIKHADFKCDNENRLIRNNEDDIKVLKRILKNFIKEAE